MIFDGKPTVIGHRGFGAGEPGGHPENTMRSYLAAAEQGLSWIELDVQRSRDGHLVIQHDPVTPDGEFVVTRSADELGAAGVPRFDDVMAELPADVAVDIDVKTIIQDAVDPPRQRTDALVADALRKHAGQRRLLVSSFDPALLLYLKEQQVKGQSPAEIPLALLTWLNFPQWHAIPAATNLGMDAIGVHTGTFGLHRERPWAADHATEQVIDVAHRAGLEVLAWVPGPEDAAALASAGADALCVNDVPGVLAALAG
jgi:glycerophosphoryl diester phosphodiesterase